MSILKRIIALAQQRSKSHRSLPKQTPRNDNVVCLSKED